MSMAGFWNCSATPLPWPGKRPSQRSCRMHNAEAVKAITPANFVHHDRRCRTTGAKRLRKPLHEVNAKLVAPQRIHARLEVLGCRHPTL